MPAAKSDLTSDRVGYMEHYQLHHTPTTDILKRINEATAKKLRLLDVKITPAIAKDLLTANALNRHVRKADVRRLVDDMLAGKWIQAGDSICFSSEGRMIDGQHRCIAIIQSGTSQIYDIVTGLSPEAFNVKDTGRMRSAGDALSDRDFKHVNTFASAIKSEIYFKRDGKLGHFLYQSKVANWEVKEWVQDPGNTRLMAECVEYACGYLRENGTFLSPSSWAFIFYIFSKIHKGDALFFVNAFAGGEDISKTKYSSIYLVRSMLINLMIKRNKLEAQKMMPFPVKIHYIITAWNLFRDKINPSELVIVKATRIPKPH